MKMLFNIKNLFKFRKKVLRENSENDYMSSEVEKSQEKLSRSIVMFFDFIKINIVDIKLKHSYALGLKEGLKNFPNEEDLLIEKYIKRVAEEAAKFGLKYDPYQDERSSPEIKEYLNRLRHHTSTIKELEAKRGELEILDFISTCHDGQLLIKKSALESILILFRLEKTLISNYSKSNDSFITKNVLEYLQDNLILLQKSISLSDFKVDSKHNLYVIHQESTVTAYKRNTEDFILNSSSLNIPDDYLTADIEQIFNNGNKNFLEWINDKDYPIFCLDVAPGFYILFSKRFKNRLFK